MTTSLRPSIRKRIWTNDPTSTNVAELARDTQAAVSEVDGKLMIATFTNLVWSPPVYIDTQGRCPDAVVPGSAQGVGAPAHSSFASGGMLWDFIDGKVRVISAGSLIVGSPYNFSILLFFGGG
jgi:hypothetical protein